MLQKIEVFEICYLLPGRKFKLSLKDTYFQILSQFLPTFTLHKVMKIKSLKGLKYKFVFKYVLGNLVSFIGSCVKIFLKMFLVHFLLFLIQFLNE